MTRRPVPATPLDTGDGRLDDNHTEHLATGTELSVVVPPKLSLSVTDVTWLSDQFTALGLQQVDRYGPLLVEFSDQVSCERSVVRVIGDPVQ